jgi:azurin
MEGFAVTDLEFSDDLIWGVQNIAQFIAKTKRQTHWLLYTGQLPAKKVGHQWVASRAALRHALTGSPKIQANAA